MSGARYISSRVVKMLYAHSGNECANPSCHAKLVYVEDNAKDEQICHIEAASSKGPRYNPNQTEEERNGYDNLILLCHKCHDMIDNNPEKYTVELLKQWKKEHEDKYKNANKEKVFRTPIPDGLLPRDKEVDKLFDGISKNRIYNLIGVGGSGKSSLAYLMVQKYKDLFNEIAYVVINTDIKQNIADQLNRTLKFELNKDLYLDVVSHLQENFKSEQPNLLVLDINETADKVKIDNFITEILPDNLFLEGWKFLILTRENVDTRNRIASHNLKDEDDLDFLKKLFLDRAGERYVDFGDFETLFRIIFYNPLLAEQLGFYLSNEPQTATIDDIITTLYGTTFREEDMQGMSAQRHDETIVSFLKNLIVYDKLDKNEQTLLRHFVLWQSDYISYDVIADLLKGVFETDSVLKKVLKTLTSRSIIVTQINDEKVLCYKLHGLLAYSLREQIDFKEEDWDGYVDNIRRIIKYSYYKFVPYTDCIGNSLCEYDDISFTYSNIMFNYGLKFQESSKYYYAHFLYEKNIAFLTIAIDGIPNHPEWQMDLLEQEINLSRTYHNLAMLQELYDIEAARESYNKSIDILEPFFKDNTECQEIMISSCSNLASLLSNLFNDFKSAKIYFDKAITIGEQSLNPDLYILLAVVRSYNNYANFLSEKLSNYDLAKAYYDKAKNTIEHLPENNPEVQYLLASIYGAMARMQFDLNDIESAKENFNQAIAIGERLSEEDPEYKYSLSKSYHNLAILQCKNLEEYESARTNYEKAIEVGERLPKDNPEYQFTLAKVYFDFAKFQKEHLDGYESAKSNFEKAIAIGKLLPKENSEYQHELANAYMGLAFIEEKQKKYSDAESNAFSAINIYKQLEEFLLDLCLGLNSEAFLADLYLTTGKTAQAKEILDRIQPLVKKCLADNPNEDFVILLNKGVDEIFDQCSQKLNQEN